MAPWAFGHLRIPSGRLTKLGKRVQTTRLATILFSACAATFPLSPKTIAQTPNADCATESTSSTKACEAGTMRSVLRSGEQESATPTSSARLDQNDWVHRWMRTVDQVR